LSNTVLFTTEQHTRLLVAALNSEHR